VSVVRLIVATRSSGPPQISLQCPH